MQVGKKPRLPIAEPIQFVSVSRVAGSERDRLAHSISSPASL
jgi:hypothetical protein